MPDEGLHGCLVENMHDTPYLRGGDGPEIVAAMAVVARAVRDAGRGLALRGSGPGGGQPRRRSPSRWRPAWTLSGSRASASPVADEGLISPRPPSCSGTGGPWRGAYQVSADIKKKHSSHAITADIGIGATARAVEFMRGDAMIVTGAVTGRVFADRRCAGGPGAARLPVYLGSGVTAANLPGFLGEADGFIVELGIQGGRQMDRHPRSRRGG